MVAQPLQQNLGHTSREIWMETPTADSPCSQGTCRLSHTLKPPQLTAVTSGLVGKPHLHFLELWIEGGGGLGEVKKHQGCHFLFSQNF